MQPRPLGSEQDLWLASNWVQQRCSDTCEYIFTVISDITVMSAFRRDSFPGWLRRSKLPYCDLPYGAGHMARDWGQLWLQETEAPRLTACKQQNDANDQVILEADPSPCRPWMKLQPPDPLEALWDSETEDPVKLCPDSWHCRNHEVIIVCCLTPLYLW